MKPRTCDGPLDPEPLSQVQFPPFPLHSYLSDPSSIAISALRVLFRKHQYEVTVLDLNTSPHNLH